MSGMSSRACGNKTSVPLRMCHEPTTLADLSLYSSLHYLLIDGLLTERKLEAARSNFPARMNQVQDVVLTTKIL